MCRAYGIPLPALVSADPYGTLCSPLLDRERADDAVLRLMQQARQAGQHALILRSVALDGAAMKAFAKHCGARACARACCSPIFAPVSTPRATRRIAARGARRQEAEGAAPPAPPPRRPRRGSFRRGAYAGRGRDRARNVSGAGSQRLEGQARHRARTGRWRCGLHPPRHRGAWRRPASARSSACAPATRRWRRRSCCGIRTARSTSSSASTSVLRKFSPGVQLTLDLTAASLRRSRHRLGRFHREPRSSHDQPDLARTACDRRRADPAAAARSRRRPDPCCTRPCVKATPRAGAPPRSFRSGSARRNPHEQRHRGRAGDYGRSRCAAARLSAQAVRDPSQAGRPSAADAAAHRAARRRTAARPDRI